jgi:glycosyltransferase involved in cell wall biosynthesis
MSGSIDVSVALCTCNGASYLREQLDSILAQTRPVAEIVVGDDASTDETREILLDYAARCPARFRLHLHPERLGTVDNFGFVLAQCGGRVIFLSDQDDVWKPRKVETMLARFDDPHAMLVFTDGRLIDAAGTPMASTLWKAWRFDWATRLRWKRSSAAVRDLVHNHNKVTGATAALRRELLDDCLPIRVPPGYWHDAWLALHAAAHGGLRYMAEPLIDYRVHGGQQIGITRDVDLRPMGEAWSVSFAEFREALRERYPDHAQLLDDGPRPFRDSAFGTQLRSAWRALRPH